MGVRPAEHERVDDAAQGTQHGGDDDGEQLDPVRAQAEHRRARLVLAHGGHCATGPGADEHGHDDPGDHDEAEREPVAVGRVGDPDEQLGHGVTVEHLALLASGHAARVAHDDDRGGLREGEGHHGERDPANAQRDGTDDEREHRRGDERKGDRGRQRERPRRERDGEQVAAGGDEERMTEAEQACAPEEHVVGQGGPGDDEARREQLHRTRPVDPPRQESRHLGRHVGQVGEHCQHEQRQHDLP